MRSRANACVPFTCRTWPRAKMVGPLNVLILPSAPIPHWRPPPTIPFLHEDVFAKRMPKKGLITKREVRLLSLASLRLRPNSVMWDIGAGSGSVAIEAALLAPEGRVYAIEVDPRGCRDLPSERADACGVDNVRMIAVAAPCGGAFTDLEEPDAVFVGGSKGSMAEIIGVASGPATASADAWWSTPSRSKTSAEAYQTLREGGLTAGSHALVQTSRAANRLAHYTRDMRL